MLAGLLRHRRAAKQLKKQVQASDPDLAEVLEARQLSLKLCANASYGPLANAVCRLPRLSRHPTSPQMRSGRR